LEQEDDGSYREIPTILMRAGSRYNRGCFGSYLEYSLQRRLGSYLRRQKSHLQCNSLNPLPDWNHHIVEVEKSLTDSDLFMLANDLGFSLQCHNHSDLAPA